MFRAESDVRVAALCLCVALAACYPYPDPPDTDEPKTSSLVACVKIDSRGFVKDGYIITSVGDSVSVYRLFLRLLRARFPETAILPPSVEEAYVGWQPISYLDKNGPMLPVPASCKPKN